MKKNYILVLILFTIASCAKNELSNDYLPSVTSNIVNTSIEGFEPNSVMENCIKNNPEFYIFSNPHSELWMDEISSNSKRRRITTSQPAISVTGYDMKTQISSYVTSFPSGLSCDSRVNRGVSYLSVKFQYKKTITIPKGADLILPPQTLMSTYIPMGNKPGTTVGEYGYSSAFVSTDGIVDTYYLITEGREIVYNSSGQQVAPLDNPIYTPCKIITPSQLIFKYQYTTVDW
jgi:hypothetical protein